MPKTPYAGIPGVTTKIASTDVAATLETLGVSIPENVIGGFITCETQPARFAYNAIPIKDGATALGHVLATSGELKLESGAEVRKIKFISKVGAAHATLQVTLYSE